MGDRQEFQVATENELFIIIIIMYDCQEMDYFFSCPDHQILRGAIVAD